MSRARKAAYAAAALGSATAAAGALLKFGAPDVVDDIKQFITLMSLARHYKAMSIVDLLEMRSRERPKKKFLIFEGQAYTFQDADEWTNRVAKLFHRLGVVKGDRVALLMRNEPSFVWLFFGLLKIGATVTLINHNLRLQSLQHCIMAGGCKYMVVSKDADLLAAAADIAAELISAGVRLLAYTEGGHAPPMFERSIADDVAQLPGDPLPNSMRAKVQPSDMACHIFTSGTTGLPKAVKMLHWRLPDSSAKLLFLAGITEEDVLYTGLPLYHSAGLILVNMAVLKGCTVVLSRKFSPRSFWDDCRRNDVTVIQYIGEICRYLLAVPERPDDAHHRVRMAFGNGLRMDIWQEFKTRFNIPLIREWYGASEGTFGFMNRTNTVGSCGRLSAIMQALSKVYGIRYDVENDTIVRDANGLCCLAGPGEAALYVACITEWAPFVGYEGDKAQNEKKIVRNVFKKGDAYYNSGDLFIRDGHGNMYFVDRIGDTFRWKGENVATIDVSNVLSRHMEIQDAIVYGVAVPGHDGRAGMSALCLRQGAKVDDGLLQSLYKHVTTYLPSYAQPYFLRFLDEVPLTSTFKYSATTLKKDGFDPSKVGTAVYFKSRARCTYVTIDSELLAQIKQGTLEAHQPGKLPLNSHL